MSLGKGNETFTVSVVNPSIRDVRQKFTQGEFCFNSDFSLFISPSGKEMPPSPKASLASSESTAKMTPTKRLTLN